MTSPKVMQLCLSDGLGGLELYVFHCSVQLQQRGVNVLPVVREGTMLYERMVEAGIEPQTHPKASRYLPLLSARRLARLAEREAIDLIHVHWGKDLLLASLIKRFCRRPLKLVYTRQMMITRSKQDIYHRFVYQPLDLLLTITDELLELNRRYLPMEPERIQRLYYGVEACEPLTAEQRQQQRDEFGCHDPETFLVGLVGRVEALKGQHLLVEAVAQLRADGLPVQAVIIGPTMGDDYLDTLRSQIESQGLGDAVMLYGPHPRPTAIMQVFDSVVLATRKETFGLVLAEAMRAGVAVVGTNAGGVPEIIEDGASGLLFEPDNSASLTTALRRLATDATARSNMAQAGKERADELFALEQHYDALQGHFEALTDS